ncbi:MAG: hypothetical protein Q8Q48_00735 [Candidatus Staskawiczbacteria bacterium]|nr:hypothetical protein [Candidatus Staskawiczbacteria bacterium]
MGKNKIPLLILFIVSILGGIILLPAPKAEAVQADATLTVTNSLPVGSSVSIDAAAASVTLTEATTATVTATFTVTDNNGCDDIDSHISNDTVAVFFRTNVAGGAACTPDDANCYSMSCGAKAGCTPGGSDLTATFSCTADVQFYADATDAGATYEANDWTATATPRDSAGTDGTPSSDTIEMDSLTALSATASITYGALALGADTATTDQTTVITNTGNRQIDAQVDGYGAEDGDGKSMACTIGTVSIELEKYDISASTAYASKTALSDTAATITAFNLAQGASSTKDIYWGMGLPETGVGGSCTGKVNFTATNG